MSKVIKKVSIWFKRLPFQGSLKQYYAIYLVAFAIIALVAVLSQVFIQNYLGNQSEDSYLINVAGKQRMLSQKITKNLLLFSEDKQEVIKSELSQDLEAWAEKHQLLSTNELIRTNFNTDQIDSRYKLLQPIFLKMYSNSKSYINTNEKGLLKEILNLEKQYLRIMDDIVYRYDANYKNKIVKLRRIEFGLSFILVLVLILEMLLVFIPLIRMLSKAFDNLTNSEQSAKELAKSLNISNLSLQLKNKEINDITLALDKAVILIKTDPNGKIIYANQKYCVLTKYSLDQLVGKPLFYNNQGGAENVIYHHIRNKHENSKVWQSEVYDNASDGTDFYLDVTLFPVINNDGDLYEYLVICSDITKRKNTEKELQAVTEQRFLKQEQEQKIKSKSIIQGQEVERRRMAVEVHDGLGQMLTALKFNCEALESDEAYQNKVIENMKQLLHQVIVETRRISSDLLPTVLSDFGLIAALKEMVKSVNSVTDKEIIFVNNFKMTGRLSHEKEIAAYRIAQESLNNALKHSQSKMVELSLSSDAEYMYLSVQDNGGGIDTQAPKDSRSGNGLRNMHERARLVDGKLYIDSVKNKGTKVLVEIPID